MKDIYEVLRHKELELSRLANEIEALRVVAPLLSDEDQVANDAWPTSESSTAPVKPVRLPQAVNDSPRPADRPDWKDKAKRWP